MLIEIKGFTKFTKYQLAEHMEYDAGQGKPKWKTSMMFMDAIHVHVERGKKNGKVGGSIFVDIDDCL